MKRKNIKYLKYGITFLILILIIYMSPLTADDWGWGTNYSNIVSSFKNAIRLWNFYNGRVLGFTFIYFMSAHSILGIISESTIIFFTIFFLSKFSNKKNSYWLVLFLFLGMNIAMYREVIAWKSGFWNFAIPPLMLTIYLLLNKKIFFEEKNKINYSKVQTTICFFLGLFMNFFAEHSALLSVIIAIGLILFTRIANKKIYNIQISFLIGSILGCTLMFLSPSYWGIMPRLENTVFAELNFIEKITFNLKNTIWLKELVLNNSLLNIVLTLIILKDFKKNNNTLKICCIIQIILSLVSIYISIKYSYFNQYFKNFSVIKYIVLNIIYYVNLNILLIIKYKKSTKKMLWYNGLLLASILGTITLLAADTFGARCFYNSYIIFIIFTISLYNEDKYENKFEKISTISMNLLYVIILLYMVICNYISYKQQQIIIQIAKQRNDNEIKISLYPYSQIIHLKGIPSTKYNIGTFKNLYGINKDTKIYIIKDSGYEYELSY